MHADPGWSPGRMSVPEPESETGQEADVAQPTAAAEEPFRPVPNETFQEHRQRLDRAETLPFAPVRRGNRHASGHNSVPYDVMFVNGDGCGLELPEDWNYEDGIFTLSERRMSPDERAAFRADKCRELTDFFTNHVWEFETTNEATPERTMRARFLLKWSKHADGSPRAKARLILQGFNDPDALNGTLNTSSPTATRLARLSVLAICALKGWKPWVADVATAFLQSKPQKRVLHVQLPRDALDLLGAPENTRMRLIKPMYGQTDAPRSWYLEACERLKKLALLPHPLDPCLFLHYRDDVNRTLDGLVVMHVDDLLGGGCLIDYGSRCWKAVLPELQKGFNFRTWTQSGVPGSNDLEYLGSNIHVHDDGGIHVNYADYARKIKPVTVNANIKDVNMTATANEVRQLRGLLGSLQWPASQGCPHLACSVSMLQGEFGTATRRTLLDANKALRFFKNNSQVSLSYRPLTNGYRHDLTDVGFVAATDAAWATRRDGSSQGGYLVMLVSKECFDGQTSPFMVLDWRSQKLRRVSRSSLNSEAQAAASAVDALEQVKVFWALIMQPDLDPREDSTMAVAGPSALLTDAKALYDAAQKEHVGNFEDRRTGIEVMVIKERMQASGSAWRWCSSERQYADGLTKIAARQLLADRIQAATFHLYYDETYTAAKKKTLEQRRESVRQTVTPTATTATAALVMSMMPRLAEAASSDPIVLYDPLLFLDVWFADAVNFRYAVLMTCYFVFSLTGYLLFVILACCVWCSKPRTARLSEPGASVQTTVLLRDVAVQGPAHHDGRRYWADTQGFRQGFSVEPGPVYAKPR